MTKFKRKTRGIQRRSFSVEPVAEETIAADADATAILEEVEEIKAEIDALLEKEEQIEAEIDAALPEEERNTEGESTATEAELAPLQEEAQEIKAEIDALLEKEAQLEAEVEAVLNEEALAEGEESTATEAELATIVEEIEEIKAEIEAVREQEEQLEAEVEAVLEEEGAPPIDETREANPDDKEKEIELELESVEDEEKKNERMIVEGYAATFGTPYQLWRGGGEAFFERVDARAFDKAEMRDVILQYDHGGRVFARQSNGTLEIKTDRRGLYIRADLSGTEEGRKLYQEIKDGYTTKMSLSFTIEDEETRELPEEEVIGYRTGSTDRFYLRTIKRIGRVYDVSAVSLPANEGTRIKARSAAKQNTERARLLFNIKYQALK